MGSSTLLFERCYSWKGLIVNIEPSTYYSLQNSRPNAHTMLLYPFCRHESIVELMHPSRLSGKKRNRKGIAKFATNNTDVVHCGPLWNYFEDIKVERVNYLVLNIPGTEIDILKTIDFSAVCIEVIVVKYVHRKTFERKVINRLLRKTMFRAVEDVHEGYATYVSNLPCK